MKYVSRDFTFRNLLFTGFHQKLKLAKTSCFFSPPNSLREELGYIQDVLTKTVRDISKSNKTNQSLKA